MNLKVVYFGTPQFAAVVLQGLLREKVHVVGVVTRADKPQKRSSKPVASPVKSVALASGIPLLQPEKASDPQFIAQLKEFQADVFVVVAYGAILRQTVLDIPQYGCYNLHAGLLPAYRGAAPIQRCIMDGVKESGNTVIRMDAGMDTGDIANVSHVPIPSDMTAGKLAETLSDGGADILIKTLCQIEEGTLRLVPQDHTQATLAPKLSKEEGFLDWNQPAERVYAHIRGVTPAPGAWTLFSIADKPAKRLVIRKARLKDAERVWGTPGQVLISSEKELLIACSSGAISLIEVQPEGKPLLSCKDFLNGIPKEGISICFN